MLDGSTDPITLEFEIPEGSYDDLVSFTNAFNFAMDKAATSHDAGFGGTTAKDLAKKVRLDFDVDSSGTPTNGQVNFALKEQTGATAGDQSYLEICWY